MGVVGNIGEGATALVQDDEVKGMGFAWTSDGQSYQSWHLAPGFEEVPGNDGKASVAWTRRSTVWDASDWRDHLGRPEQQEGLRADAVVIGRPETWPDGAEGLTAMLDALPEPATGGAGSAGGLDPSDTVSAIVHDGVLVGHRLQVGGRDDPFWYELWQLDTRCRPPDLPEGYTLARDVQYTGSGIEGVAWLNKRYQGGWLRFVVKYKRVG